MLVGVRDPCDELGMQCVTQGQGETQREDQTIVKIERTGMGKVKMRNYRVIRGS